MEPGGRAELLMAFSTLIEDKHSEWADMLEELGSRPSGLTIGQCGEYIIVDSDTKVVKVFDHNGEFTHAFGQKVLEAPVDVTMTASGKIVVTDQGAGDVKVFSRRGKLLVTSEFGMHLLGPHGIDYNPYTKHIAVCDQSANCVFVHDPNGVVQCVLTLKQQQDDPSENGEEEKKVVSPEPVEEQRDTSTRHSDHEHENGHLPIEGDRQTLSGSDSRSSLQMSEMDEISLDNFSDNADKGGIGKLPSFSPAYVKFDPYSSNIFVSDHATHNVYAFDQFGEVTMAYPPEKMSNPSGICIHPSGDVLVADTESCSIQRLDRHGRLLESVVTWEDGMGDPQALTINMQGHLVVTEGNTGLVKIYRI